MPILDEKTGKILNILQKNCRASLTAIAQETGLTVDVVKKRLERLLEEKIILPKIHIRPRTLGFTHVIDVKIKIKNYDQETVDQFIDYCKGHPRITEFFAISGNWDYTIVIIAKSHEDLGKTTRAIKTTFPNLFSEWAESLTTKGYKFEDYDIEKLINEEQE
ncbi:Lrp/AsnC family transcriptional regulator [Candidatus Woesearchaeota archaeon]|nr:Lrp/AsnC family transcriptional regulator [Candidatus Woesearchaeota archaeon]